MAGSLRERRCVCDSRHCAEEEELGLRLFHPTLQRGRGVLKVRNEHQEPEEEAYSAKSDSELAQHQRRSEIREQEIADDLHAHDGVHHIDERRAEQALAIQVEAE